MTGIRQAEIVAALALATDLGVGKPLEHSLSACLLAVGMAQRLGVEGDSLSDTYYSSLLCFAGCTSYASTYAELVGDEVAIGKHFATVDHGAPLQMLGRLFRHAGEGYAPLPRARMLATLATVGMPLLMRSAAAHCEVARGLAGAIGLGARVQEALYAAYEVWNGHGGPRRLKGEAIPLPVRIFRVAFDAAAFAMTVDREAALVMARERAGRSYDPAVVECFCRYAPELFHALDVPSLWEAVLAAEPGEPRTLSANQTDAALEAIADFTDIKTPFTVGHSRGVAELAAAAALRCHLSAAEVTAVRRSSLLHDVGRVAITATIWNTRGPLSDSAWEQVRLHPYYTERVLGRTHALSSYGEIAALHHERLDGSGHHRCLPGAMLSPTARILAAADVCHALTEARPHREALSPDAAADTVLAEMRAGRLDGPAADAVLSVAGHEIRGRRRAHAGGLSEREVEVLRLLAHGLSNRQMAQELFISEKTVGHHIQHIYDKIGCSTRPSATLFAIQHDLLEARTFAGTLA